MGIVCRKGQFISMLQIQPPRKVRVESVLLIGAKYKGGKE